MKYKLIDKTNYNNIDNIENIEFNTDIYDIPGLFFKLIDSYTIEEPYKHTDFLKLHKKVVSIFNVEDEVLNYKVVYDLKYIDEYSLYDYEKKRFGYFPVDGSMLSIFEIPHIGDFANFLEAHTRKTVLSKQIVRNKEIRKVNKV